MFGMKKGFSAFSTWPPPWWFSARLPQVYEACAFSRWELRTSARKPGFLLEASPRALSGPPKSGPSAFSINEKKDFHDFLNENQDRQDFRDGTPLPRRLWRENPRHPLLWRAKSSAQGCEV